MSQRMPVRLIDQVAWNPGQRLVPLAERQFEERKLYKSSFRPITDPIILVDWWATIATEQADAAITKAISQPK